MAKVKKGSNPDGVVYVKLPPGLIDRLDNQIARGEFRSRSEGIREAVSNGDNKSKIIKKITYSTPNII